MGARRVARVGARPPPPPPPQKTKTNIFFSLLVLHMGAFPLRCPPYGGPFCYFFLRVGGLLCHYGGPFLGFHPSSSPPPPVLTHPSTVQARTC